MGTRADFYVGKGTSAEWMGSIGWDGYPSGNPKSLISITSESEYREAVCKIIKEEGGTTPDMGWPWPWEDSNTTDYSYTFDAGRVWGTCFGHGWWAADNEPTEEDQDPGKISDWPNMKNIQNVAKDPTRSGIFIVGG